MDVEYDNSFGYTKVALDLVVVGEDWWLERHEYWYENDCSGWWEFKRMPVKPTKSKMLDRVISNDDCDSLLALMD